MAKKRRVWWIVGGVVALVVVVAFFLDCNRTDERIARGLSGVLYSGYINSASVSAIAPSGSMVVVRAQKPTRTDFLLIDLASGKTTRAELPSDVRSVKAILATPNSQLVVGFRGACAAVDPKDGKELWRLKFPSSVSYCRAVDESGSVVLAASREKLVRIKRSSGDTLTLLDSIRIHGASLSPDGEYAVALLDDAAVIFETQSGNRFAEVSDLGRKKVELRVFWLTRSRIAIRDDSGISIFELKPGNLLTIRVIDDAESIDAEGNYCLVFDENSWELELGTIPDKGEISIVKSWKMPLGYLGTADLVPNSTSALTAHENGEVRIWR